MHKTQLWSKFKIQKVQNMFLSRPACNWLLTLSDPPKSFLYSWTVHKSVLKCSDYLINRLFILPLTEKIAWQPSLAEFCAGILVNGNSYFPVPALKSVSAAVQRVIFVVLCWRLSSLARKRSSKQLVLAGVRHRSVATVWHLETNLAFYSEEKIFPLPLLLSL